MPDQAFLLPNAMQAFTDSNGYPLAGGTVAFFVPGTDTPKDTWQDADQTIINSNPLTLDGSGRAIIYGIGVYRQIVYDSSNNTIWDQLTAAYPEMVLAGGLAGGSGNAITLTLADWNAYDSTLVSLIVKATNSGATSVTINGTGPAISIVKDTSSGPVTLSGGELVTSNLALLDYDATGGVFHLINPAVGSSQPTPGARSGLSVTVTSDTQVQVQAKSVALAGSTSNITIGSTNATANVSVNGANGLDTGSVAPSQWYAVYIIYNFSTNVIATLLSLSGTSPTLPSGFSYSKRVGWVITNASSHFFRTIQTDDTVSYVVGTNPTAPITMAFGAAGSISAPTWAAVSVTPFVPTTAREILVSLSCFGASPANAAAMAAESSGYGAITNTSNTPPLIVNSILQASIQSWLPLQSTNIYWANDGAHSYNLNCNGWRDTL